MINHVLYFHPSLPCVLYYYIFLILRVSAVRTQVRTHDSPSNVRRWKKKNSTDDRATEGEHWWNCDWDVRVRGGDRWITTINETKKRRYRQKPGRGNRVRGSARGTVVVRCGNRAQCVYHPLGTGGGTETPSAWVPVPQGRAWPVGSPAD